VELHPHSPHAVLSARQLEVAKLVAAGDTTREIADRLSLSPRTVETHIAAIFEKLGVRTRAQLAALVVAEAPVETQPGNIPRWLTPLIGREADLAAIDALMKKHRIVTILGTGGLGKTQAAIRIAANAGEAFADGAWFVDLASLSSDAFVSMEIARTLNISLPAGEDPHVALASRLKQKTALLLLDNCEHLIRPIATIAATLTKTCPDLSLLATSREPLGITGEATYRLPSLDATSAASLFSARADALNAKIGVDANASQAIAEICRRLDGLPLAIELAAARSVMLSPRELLERLDGRFALLHAGLRDVLPRHQSLRALIDWSYEQLDEREQAIFRRLSPFTGTFSLEAAHAMSGAPDDRDFETIALLSSLIDKSLVALERQNGAGSYRLLESIRAYARLQLQERGEFEIAARLHLRYLVDAMKRINTLPPTTKDVQTTIFLRSQIGDIRAALDWAIDTPDVVLGARLLIEIGHEWSSASVSEGIARNEAFAAAVGEQQPGLRSRLLSLLAELRWRNGDLDLAIAAGARALRFARVGTDDKTLGHALIAVATTSIHTDRDRSRALVAELQSLPNATNYLLLEGRRLEARIAYFDNDFTAASASFRSLLEEARRRGDTVGQGEELWMLANVQYNRGDCRSVVELCREALALVQRGDDAHYIAMVTRSLAGFLVATGAYQEAERTARDGLALYADVDPSSLLVATLIEVPAFVAATRGAIDDAAVLAGFANARRARPGTIIPGASTSAAHDRLECFFADAIAARTIGKDELASLQARGARLPPEDAIALAMGDAHHR
jgi:predicted ATPase/DNA-binding CsgD family transcriptional regulator